MLGGEVFTVFSNQTEGSYDNDWAKRKWKRSNLQNQNHLQFRSKLGLAAAINHGGVSGISFFLSFFF